jgi:hypothetical protein
MQRKLLEIINVDFNARGQLLIIYFAFVKYLSKMGIKEAEHKLFIDYRDNLGDRGVDGRIILRWIFTKWDVEVWTGSNSLRIGTIGGHFRMQ